MFEETPLLWLLLLIPAYYLGVPLIIRSQQRMTACPHFEELDLNELDRPTAQFLLTRTKALVEIGFDEPTLVAIVGAVRNVSTYFIMLVNRQAGDRAFVTAMKAQGAAATISTSHIEFSTRFDNGMFFDTHNSNQLPAFPAGPDKVRTHVPSVADPAELYALHRFVMKKHHTTGRTVVYDPGKALDWLTRVSFRESYERQAARGWLYYQPGCDCFRFTLKGAYLVTWGLLQPFKALRYKALKTRETQILAEFAEARALS